MTTSGGSEAGGRTPGERRLARPPSERYGTADPGPATSDVPARGSAGRAAGYGLLAAIVVAVAITVVGGVLLITAGLIAVAALGGWAIGIGVRTGGGTVVAPSRRIALAVGLAGVAILGGQLGLWALARTEGGVLGPLEYLGETFGFLVPLELAAALATAWLSAR